MAGQSPVDQDPALEISISNSDTPHSVRLLWTSDWPVQRPLPDITHNTHKRQMSMPTAGFEPSIAVSEPLQARVLDHAASGIGF